MLQLWAMGMIEISQITRNWNKRASRRYSFRLYQGYTTNKIM